MAAEPRTLSPEQLLEHVDWLRRLAGALVRDRAEADDLAQETVQVALANPPEIDRPVRPWLAGVARNLARFRARGDARRAARELRADELRPDEPTPEQLVERVQLHRLLADKVLVLEEPFRQTVLLRYYEGLSAADIARRMDIPAGTVRWRLKRGLELLRAELDRDHEGDRARWCALLAPLALPSSPTVPLLAGVIAMKTVTKLAVLLALAVALIVGTRLAGLWGGGATPATTAAAPQPARPAAAPPAALGVRFETDSSGRAIAVVAEIDPDGTLRLEGQIIDGDEQPIGGAAIAIDTSPPRHATSEADGSFAFAGLAPRAYELEARAGELYAGPVTTRLSADSEPVILRATAGASVRVVVRDGAGAPVAGARVALRSMLAWETETDAGGEAVLAGVGPGWRTLRVEAARFAPAARMVSTGDRAGEERIVVRLDRGAPVSGRVVSAAGAPVAGARVWASAASEPFPVIDPQLDAVVTDADGRWQMAALAAGTYRFAASHPAHAQTTTAPIALSGATARDGVDIQLDDGGVLAGRVVDAAGAPVAGAELRVAARGGGVAWRLLRVARAGGDGRFSIAGLPRRGVEIVAHHDGGSSDIVAADLRAAPRAEVELRTAASAPIAGVVVDAAGEPMPEAQVAVDPVFGGGVGEREAWQVRGHPRAITDAAGAFSFGGLPPGRYTVRAARPGAPPAALALHAGVDAAPGDAALRVVLPRETVVRGRVTVKDRGAPELFAISVDGTQPTPFSTEDGAFEIVAPAGEHNLFVSGPAFVTALERVTVKDGAATDVGTIEVIPGRSISGRVVDSSGAPVEGARVAAGRLLSGSGTELNIPDEGHDVQETTTDDRGRFLIPGLDARAQVVVAGHPDRGRSPSIAIPGGTDSVELEIALVDTGAVAGTVTRDGEPLGEVVVIAKPLAALSANFFTVTGPDGSYSLDRLAEGEYMVHAMIGGGGPKPKDIHWRTVTITAGKRLQQDIAIADGVLAMEVRVVTAEDGAGVPMAQVFVSTGDYGDWMESTEALMSPSNLEPEGTSYIRAAMGGAAARIEGATPGTYTLCAMPIPPGSMNEGRDSLRVKCKVMEISEPPSEPIAIEVPTEWTVSKP